MIIDILTWRTLIRWLNRLRITGVDLLMLCLDFMGDFSSLFYPWPKEIFNGDVHGYVTVVHNVKPVFKTNNLEGISSISE